MTIQEETRQKIKEIEDFTCEYWWPILAEAEKESARKDVGMNTPARAAIIRGIIETRSRYVNQLRHSLDEHQCSVGCPYYSSGHSINADGYCNMGCC